MHWIQKHIMRELSMHPSRRYSDVKPGTVEGNLFMYHMQQLQKDGYVCKEASAYRLSQKGKLFSSRMSLRQGSAAIQPKIVVMMVCQNGKGDYLLFRWSRQPYTKLVSFPFSKLHFGRTITETLQEALLHKTKLKGDFTYVGDVYIRGLSNKEVIEHMLAHIYQVTNLEGLLGGYDGITGQPFWGNPNHIPPNEQVPGFIDIVKLIESNSSGFLREITVYKS